MMKHLPSFKGLAIGAALVAGLGTGQVSAQILYDNGPYFNSTGTGAGGANESVLYTTTFSMGTIGFGHQIANFNRVADDFDVTNCRWQVDSIVFFAYQTGSTTTSTMTALNFRIWDSIPDAAGSTVVYGDTTTNRLSATRWSGAYRITETTVGNSTRPIMRNVCATPGLVLSGGNFWIDWAAAGSLASGPWAPPRTPAGVAVTGNGKQRIGSTWNNLVDGGTGTPAQGLPFIIYGQILDPVADAGSDNGYCVGGAIPVLGGMPSGSGGTGPLSYLWSPGASLNDSTHQNPGASPSVTTTYVLTVTDLSTGCTDTDTVVTTVGAIASNFLPNDTVICPGGNVLLDAGAGTSYSWSTGSTTQTVSVPSGSYSVSVFDNLGCASTDTILISDDPLVEVIGDSYVCPGSLALVTVNPAFLGGSFLWSDGSTGPAINPSIGGTYSLQYTSPIGCVSYDSLTLVNEPAPAANFSFLVTGGGLDYTFSDLSAGAPLTYAWDFGDGNTSTASNPLHTYAASGSYTVTLIVSNICGSDTMTQNVTVVGVQGSLVSSAIEISPNPATNSFQVVFGGMETGSIQADLMDMQGRILQSYRIEDASASVKMTVDAAKFARGTYFLRIQNNEKTEIRKVVLE